MAESDKKSRAPRTTKKQMEQIVEFLEANKFLLAGGSQEDFQKQNKAWMELTEGLNSSGVGPQKTVSQWKAVVSELKTNVKKKARKIVIDQNKTGGGPPVNQLNEVEKKIYSLINATCVEGAPDVPEVGLNVLQRPNLQNNINENIGIEDENRSNEVDVDKVQKTPIRPRASRKRKCGSDLAAMVNLQCESQKQMAQALTSLSQSVSTLAESIVKLSSVLNK